MAFQVLKLFEIVINGSHSAPVSSLLSQSRTPQRLLPLHHTELNSALGFKLIGAGDGRPRARPPRLCLGRKLFSLDSWMGLHIAGRQIHGLSLVGQQFRSDGDE